MDQRLNPYTPGSGVKPLKLAGRDSDLEAFRVLLERLAAGRPERSLIYSGLRGVGKTVLLLEFETLTRERGWVCNDVEEVGSGDFRQIFAELAYQLLLSMSLRERMQKRANKALGVLKAFSIGIPGGLSARIDVEPATGTADSGDPERDLAVLLVEVGQVAQSGGTGAVFFLDEMQGLSEAALAAVCMAMNRGWASGSYRWLSWERVFRRYHGSYGRPSRTRSACLPTTNSTVSRRLRGEPHWSRPPDSIRSSLRRRRLS